MRDVTSNCPVLLLQLSLNREIGSAKQTVQPLCSAISFPIKQIQAARHTLRSIVMHSA